MTFCMEVVSWILNKIFDSSKFSAESASDYLSRDEITRNDAFSKEHFTFKATVYVTRLVKAFRMHVCAVSI